MIIACPACSTRYAVPDSAIGVEGRTVRCAKCRHSWFQEGPELDLGAPVARVIPPPPPPPPPPVVEDRPAEPAAEVAADDPPLPSTVTEDPTPPPSYASSYEDAPSSFAHEPPFRARRNPAKMWTLAAVVFAVVSLGAVGLVTMYGLPDWVPLSRSTFADAQPGLELDFPPNQQKRQSLPNGTEYFKASGTITNVGRERRSVPSILIVMSDAQGQIVRKHEVASPKSQLAPGESVTIDEAVTDAPKSAKMVEIGWKPG